MRVICDDTDVFVLLVFYHWNLHMNATITMEATSGDRKLINIGNTVNKHKEIVPNILAAHAVSGCDTVAQYYGIGKATVLKKLQAGITLSNVGQIDSDMKEVFQEATLLISSCYGYPSKCMTEARIKAWSSKTGRAKTCAPSLASIPPTSQSFHENVKRAHFQAMQWYSANTSAPEVDPIHFGWLRDEKNKTLVPIGLPSNSSAAPPQVLEMIKCSCRSGQPCVSNRCSCSSANLACTMICSCQGKRNVCCNQHTKQVMTDSEEDDSDEENELEL